MKYLKPLLTAVLPTALIFAVSEVVARATGAFSEDDSQPDAGMINSPTLGWDRRPGFKGVVVGSYREFDSNGLHRRDSLELANGKGPAALFLGGSVTFGSGLEFDSTFGELLRSTGVRSVNAGMIGFSSFQGRVMLTRLEKLVQPDIIVVEFNLHDRVGVHPLHVDRAEYFRRVYGRSLSTTFLRSHAVRALRAGLIGAGIIRGEACLTIDAMVPRVPPETFRENLTAMAQLASRRHARLIFLNIGQAPWIRRELQEVETLLAQAQWDSAAKRLAPIASGDPEYYCCMLLARLMIAHALRQQGLADSAMTIECIGERFAPMVSDEQYVQVMREVATAAGGMMVEVPQLLTDSLLFLDDNHLSAAGHRRLASVLAPLIAGHPSAERNREPGDTARR